MENVASSSHPYVICKNFDLNDFMRNLVNEAECKYSASGLRPIINIELDDHLVQRYV